MLKYFLKPNRASNKIPKLIHRIWPGKDNIRIDYSGSIALFNRVFPEHTNVFWDGNSCEQFLKQFYPDHIDLYSSLRSYASKSDMIRYMVLNKYGGIYTDYDVILKNRRLLYKYLTSSHTCVLITEAILPEESKEYFSKIPIREGVPEALIRVANYFICTEPGHPFFSEVINEMLIRLRKFKDQIRDPYDVIFTTGPDVLSSVYDKYNSDVFLAPLKNSQKMILHTTDGLRGWRKVF